MKVATFALMASVAVRSSVRAFAPTTKAVHVALAPRTTNLLCFSTTTEGEEASICDVPNDGVVQQLKDQPKGGQILRNLDLTAADGTTVNLGTQMGDGTSMVVFLRHLG